MKEMLPKSSTEHSPTVLLCNGKKKRQWITRLALSLVGMFFICVSMPWLPPRVTAQGPAENISRQTKTVTLMTLEGQTVNREVTCEVDFNQKRWRMVFQRPLAPSTMTTQIRVHNTVIQTFPLHSAPEDWQLLSLPPELEPHLFSEGVMFALGNQPGMAEYTFLLFSRGLAKLVEFEIHPVFESEYKDAQGRSPVFPSDPVRVHYVFSRDLPAEANPMLSYGDGEKMPLRPEGEGDFILRFSEVTSGFCHPTRTIWGNDDWAEHMRLRLHFHLPQSVNTPEGTVQFQPYYDFPVNMGLVETQPKMYIYPEAIRNDDVPSPSPFSPAIVITPGDEPNSWFFSFPNADPKDMLVTTNQGLVMQSRRLGELLQYHMDERVPNHELFFGDVAPHSILAVGIVKVANPRPFPAVSVLVPPAMKNHYVELGQRVRRLPPILCESNPAHMVPRPDTLFDPPSTHPMQFVPPPSQLPPNPSVPGIVAQYRFDLSPPTGAYTVTANEPIGFYVWLPNTIIQDLNQQAPPEWHLYFPHATRLASFPQGAWYRMFINNNTAWGPRDPAGGNADPNTDPGVVLIGIGYLIFPLMHPALPLSAWSVAPGEGVAGTSTAVKFATQFFGQRIWTASWTRPNGTCARPVINSESPAPPYRSYNPAPYGRAPYLPFGQYVVNAEPSLDDSGLFGWEITKQFTWAKGRVIDEHGSFEPDWWFEVAARSTFYQYAIGVDLVHNGFAPFPVLDRGSGKIGHIHINTASIPGVPEWAQVIGYHTSQMHPDDRRITGLGCPDVNIEVSAQPTEVSGVEPVEVTIAPNGNFFYGIIEGGVESVVFQSAGTYQVMIPEGSGDLQLWVVFYGSTINCPPVVKEITIQRGPLLPSKWRISAMQNFPALKEPVPPNGQYWEGPSYKDGVPVLKALSRVYQKLYGHKDITNIPHIPERRGTSLFQEGMGTGVRQKDW